MYLYHNMYEFRRIGPDNNFSVLQIGHNVLVVSDILNISTQFDNNRSSSFGDYLSNKNPDRRQTDRRTETVERKIKSRSTESITISRYNRFF